MLILFDHGTPRSIARSLKDHTVVEAIAMTTDKNIRYRQNLKGRRLAIVVLGNPQRPAVDRHIHRVVAAVNAATPGSYAEVEISDKS
jgi:hypothetical protein